MALTILGTDSTEEQCSTVLERTWERLRDVEVFPEEASTGD